MNKFENKEVWENISWISSSSHSSLSEGELIDETNSKLSFPKNQRLPITLRSATDQSVEVSSSKIIKNSKKLKNKSHNSNNLTKGHNRHSKTHVKKQPTNMKKKEKKKNKFGNKNKIENSKDTHLNTFSHQRLSSVKKQKSFNFGEQSVMHSFLLIQKNFEQLKRATDRVLIIIIHEIEEIMKKNLVLNNRRAIGLNRLRSDNVLHNRKIQNNFRSQTFDLDFKNVENKNKDKGKGKNKKKNKRFQKQVYNEKIKTKGNGAFQEGGNYFCQSGNSGKKKFLRYMHDLLMISKEILKIPIEQMSSEKFEKYTEQVHRRCRGWGSDWPNKKISTKLLFNIARILRMVRSEESLPEYQLFKRLATTSTTQFSNSPPLHLLNNLTTNNSINNSNSTTNSKGSVGKSGNRNKNKNKQKLKGKDKRKDKGKSWNKNNDNDKNNQTNKPFDLNKLKKELKKETKSKSKSKNNHTKQQKQKQNKNNNKKKINNNKNKIKNKSKKVQKKSSFREKKIQKKNLNSNKNDNLLGNEDDKKNKHNNNNHNSNSNSKSNSKTKSRSNSKGKNKNKGKEQVEKTTSDQDEFYLLCRMCESLVRVDLLEEHSEYCVVANKSKSKLILCDERLKKIIGHIDHSLKKWKLEFKKNTSKKAIQWKVLILENFKILGNCTFNLDSNTQNYLKLSKTLIKRVRKQKMLFVDKCDSNDICLSERLERVMQEKYKALKGVHHTTPHLERTKKTQKIIEKNGNNPIIKKEEKGVLQLTEILELPQGKNPTSMNGSNGDGDEDEDEDEDNDGDDDQESLKIQKKNKGAINNEENSDSSNNTSNNLNHINNNNNNNNGDDHAHDRDNVSSENNQSRSQIKETYKNNNNKNSKRKSRESKQIVKNFSKISDFQLIKKIARGAYGRVFLAKKKKTGDIYALKVLKKEDMYLKNQVDHVTRERKIMSKTSNRNPYVVKLYYSFQTKQNLYLVMEYMPGADLFSLLQKVGGTFNEQTAKLYLAELVLILEFVHSLGIIHRDLKPDNLLIDKNGRLKLTDFGLSKIGLIRRADGRDDKRERQIQRQQQKQKFRRKLDKKKKRRRRNIQTPRPQTKDFFRSKSAYITHKYNPEEDFQLQVNFQNSSTESNESDESGEKADSKSNSFSSSFFSESFSKYDSKHYSSINNIKDVSNNFESLNLTCLSCDNINNYSLNISNNEDENGNENGDENGNRNENENGNEKENENGNGDDKENSKNDQNSREKRNVIDQSHKNLKGKQSSNLESMSIAKNNRTNLVGTPNYLAPEVLLGKFGHSFAIDWWAFGVIAYELVCGYPPFVDETIEDIFNNIVDLNIYFEDFMSDEFVDLISLLLVDDPNERLGSKGADEIKRHPFFEGIDWDNFFKTESPPWKPRIQSEIDVKYFDSTRYSNLLEHEIDQDIFDDMRVENIDESLFLTNSKNFEDFSTVNWDQLKFLNLKAIHSTKTSRTNSPTRKEKD
ncbi:serine/threonine-protein kinase pkga-related [Anaeramoeba flamelloides]|uniref:Serine/threonine-protein kinase pkga-related n=1 Tax=Anaeramoeba flamelloides TaxID=1746091 RepID=A0ABQ8Y8X8_9EUKA|nr:serine/threonine-protein kinase pkga-related [Anaeramoeba flamelloides]